MGRIGIRKVAGGRTGRLPGELDEVQHLRDRAEQLRLFVEHAPAAIAMFDRQMCYVAASRRWRQDYGIADVDVIGKCHYELFPDLPERWKDVHRRALGGEVIRSDGEDTFERADGTIQWLTWEVRPWPAPDGGVGGLLMFAEETSLRKAHEIALGLNAELERAVAERTAQLNEALSYQRLLFDTSRTGLAVCEMDGRLVDVNPSFLATIGYTQAEAGQLTYRDITPESYAELENDQLKRLLETGRYGPYEKEFRHKQGHLVPVRLSGLLIEREGRKYIWSSVEDITEERRRQEAELAAAIVEHSEDAIFSDSLDGIVLSWNRGAERLYGYTKADMVGTSITRVFPPDRIHEQRHFVTELEAGREISQFETRRVRRDGTTVDVSMTVSGIHDPTGRLVALSKCARDITERKRAEDRFRGLLESAPDAMVIVDRRGRIALVNSQSEKLFGHLREAMLGQPVEMLIPERYRAGHSQRRADFFNSPRARPMRTGGELFGVRKNGAEFPVEISLSPFGSGEEALVSAAIRDITERRKAEAQRAHLAAVIRYSDDAILSKALDGTVLSWNAGAEALFGYSAEEMVGQSITRLFPAEKVQDEAELMVRLLAGHEISHYETQRIRKDGAAVDVSVTLSVIRDEQGRAVAVSKIARDITERVRLQRRLERVTRELKQILDHSPGMIGYWNADLRCEFANQAYMAWFGKAPERIVGMSMPQLLGEVLFRKNEPYVRQVLAGSEQRFERTLTKIDGTTAVADARYVPDFDERGQVVGFYVLITDITEQKRAEQRHAEQHELLRVTLECIGDAVITADRSGRIQWLNPVASRLTGWLLSEAQGRPIEQVFHIINEETRQPAPSPLERAMVEDRVAGLAEQTVLVGRDGTEHGIEDSAAPIRDRRGNVVGIVLVFHDVTEQRRLAREVTHRASHDALTGLANRAEFETRLRRAFLAACRDGHTHALMYIDLDQFKLVNDACGHSAGDRLLREVASILQGTVRARDTLARLGGDEFGVLLENCSVQQARRVAEQVCERMENFRFVHDERRFRVGASVGLVPIDDRWSSEAEVMQAADAACYAAKEAGRNRVHEWFDTDAALKERHGEMQWVNRLEGALDERRFRLYGQRVVRCDGVEAGMHFEVLLRLLDADGALIAPAVFFPAAERFNLASRIDRWVLREVLEWMGARGVGDIDTVAVNLSGQSIGDRSFHRYARELISRAPLDPRKLCFEITETAAITHLADAEEFITSMRNLGVRIALDDFGAGASSFGYLKSLPIDFLKIDGQFVHDILEDRLDRTAVCCFRDVAAVCGVRTIAECVETEEVLAELRRIGIDFAQGYLMHRPEPLSELAVAVHPD